MSNHYEILGLRPGATPLEIKAAFRRLAKLFHPDRNPGGREHFVKIIKAYEVLSDPSLKSSYDYRLSHGLNTETRTRKRQANTKTWSFDEKEMKRRQYYNEHIKQYTKTNAHFTAPETRSTYNEYKYILFATPIAVALFLLIMNLASDPPHSHSKRTVEQETAFVPAPPKTGDALYTAFFGGALYDSLNGRNLTLSNQSGKDVIVCVFSSGQFLRSCFIGDDDDVTLYALPRKALQLYYSSGKNFSFTAKNLSAEGGFTVSRQFFKSRRSVLPGKVKELDLSSGPNLNFEEISETDLFGLANSPTI